MKDIERPKELARKKAERRWGNNDLSWRYKEAKVKAAPELAPPKTTVVTVVNPVFDEQRQLEELMQKNRRIFLRQIKSLLDEGKEQGKEKYFHWLQERKRRLLAEKLKRLLAMEKQAQPNSEVKSGDLFA